ncbi:follistatin-A-like isoform X1 [Lampetra fluviatilis]
MTPGAVESLRGWLVLGTIVLLHVLSDNSSQAGNCWLQQTRAGRCKELLRAGVSRDECCRASGPGAGFTAGDPSSATLFRWLALTGGAPNCTPCRESCEGVECAPGKRCRMNRRNRPRCVCAPDCREAHRGPVCGSDGRSYRDECAVLRARCRAQPSLSVQYNGSCRKTCEGVPCPAGMECVLDQLNGAHCVRCGQSPCGATAISSSSGGPLCGRNGVTYASACHLRRATCAQGRSIGVAHYGHCAGPPTCRDGSACEAGKRCVRDPRTGAAARCLQCNAICRASERRAPVCGSDNTTYQDRCVLRAAACSDGLFIEVKHLGRCRYAPAEEGEAGDAEGMEGNAFPGSAMMNYR